MKVKIKRDVLLDGLAKVQPVIGTRTTLPILENILFKANKDKNQLEMVTTDLDMSVRATCPATVVRPGATTLQARRIAAIFRELPDGEVDIEADDKNVSSIRCEGAFFKIVGISEEDFPPLPRFEGGNAITVEQRILKEMLACVEYATSHEENRMPLTGVFLTFKGGKLGVVATDGRRMAFFEREVDIPKGAEVDLIVPKKTVGELCRTLGNEGKAKIYAMNRQVAFEFGDLLVVSKLIEHTYPNFRQVIPSRSEERFTIGRETLLTAVRRASLMTAEKNRMITLSLSKGKMEIAATLLDVGEARDTLEVPYSGKPITISLNPDFLMDPLRTLPSDNVIVELTDELSPCVIKCELPFLYVLMPIRQGA